MLTPGHNVIKLSQRASATGKFFLGQIAFHINNLHLISHNLTPKLAVEVREEPPVVKLHKLEAPLLSGIEQIMNLIVTMGSYAVDPVSTTRS